MGKLARVYRSQVSNFKCGFRQLTAHNFASAPLAEIPFCYRGKNGVPRHSISGLVRFPLDG